MQRRAPWNQLALASTAAIILASCSGNAQTSQVMPPTSQPMPQTAGPLAQTLAAASGYTVTDLGSAAGTTSSRVGSLAPNYAGALNNLGQAAGVSSTVATLFSNGTATAIATTTSEGNGINASGQIAGQEVNAACGCMHAFLYSNGSLQDINSASVFPGGSRGYAINKSGQVVGTGYTSSTNNFSTFHAFLYSGGKMTDLHPFNGSQSIALSINDNGQIVGSSTGSSGGSFLYSNGTFSTIPISGFFINNSGQVAGENSSGHGALYGNGATTDLGRYQNVATIADGVNLSGQVVGTALFPIQSYHPFRPGKHVGLIFTASGPVSLTSLVGSSGYTITDAVAINDSGQILADATTPSGQKHAVLLTPK